ncbi:MAG: Si-specific NAD(P)(+) transhydrogenase [Leptospiraceae bacterium]|nr:Si-specific NAD(P)(+) transhydrogenase [Leptospiraceae bacterium]MCK6380881.1 Si-specific NAD(P)(+) transhydrogenase [Leptospiraceae bacterium]NUM42390.1 Si-specific NAD(P)(+) transhydrogenase [Leptospiraceae bacterium]
MQSKVKKFDIIVIGGGPAAQKAAIQSANLGKKALIIEKEEQLGGGCVHTGTIPSKSLQETSRFFKRLSEKNIHGFDTNISKKISLKELMYRAGAVIQKEERVARDQVLQSGAEILTGWGTILDKNRVKVQNSMGEEIFETDYILIATGTRPRRPENEGIPFETGFVYDSDGLFEIENLPSSMGIVGAGIIGCEYATIFANIGVKIHLFDNSERVLSFLDGEVSSSIEHYMRLSGIQLHLGTKIKQYLRKSGGIDIFTDYGDTTHVNQILISRGRVGNIHGMGLENVGIIPTDRMLIPVDANYKTIVPNIYAAGDVIGFPALASTSMYQGIQVAKHIFSNDPISLKMDDLPIGIFTLPEIAMIGPTEEMLNNRGIEYVVGKANFDTITRSQISGDTWGLLKLIAEKKSKRLLSVHIVSDRATELIALGQAVVNLKGELDYFTRHIFNYPTLSGAYKNAAMDALSKL